MKELEIRRQIAAKKDTAGAITAKRIKELEKEADQIHGRIKRCKRSPEGPAAPAPAAPQPAPTVTAAQSGSSQMDQQIDLGATDIGKG